MSIQDYTEPATEFNVQVGDTLVFRWLDDVFHPDIIHVDYLEEGDLGLEVFDKDHNEGFRLAPHPDNLYRIFALPPLLKEVHHEI